MTFLGKFLLPDEIFGRPNVREVVVVFEHLFERVDSSMLPPTAVVRPYTDDADYRDYRDNVRQWEGDKLPDGQRWTYEEIFDDEHATLSSEIPLQVRGEMLEAIEPPLIEAELTRRLPPRLQSYWHWIISDMFLIAMKRFAWGERPSRLEDLFKIYSAGYFSFGWTGVYPEAIRYLVFPGREV